MKTRKVIPLRHWPAADRTAWNRATGAGDLLDGAGPAARWSAGSRRSIASGYGRWIGYLLDHEPERLDYPPAGRMTPKAMARFIADLRRTVTPAGVFNYVKHTQDAIRVMAPGHDWAWLKEPVRQLARNVIPRNKRHRMVDADRLFDLGLRLMDTAGACPSRRPMASAIQYRDGLIIALLAARPLRRRNLANLVIGRNLLRTADGYVLAFTGSETKNHQPLEYPFPDRLVPYLAHYLEAVRTRFPGADTHGGLWASLNGRPMGEEALYGMVRNRTRAAFGSAINLHLFRDIAATTIANRDPVHVLAARDLLGHASLATTERHYNQARALETARRYQATLTAVRHELAPTSSNRRRPPCAP